MTDCLSPDAIQWMLTCEHGGNKIPTAYRPLFQGQDDVLSGHRGYDPGALDIARRLAKRLNVPFFHSTTSRLLVELNRSRGHPHLFSEYTRHLPKEAKRRILDRHYIPHRLRIERFIHQTIDEGRTVLHVGVHTFTPLLNGVRRNADIGILYDPQRPLEKEFAVNWQKGFQQLGGPLRVRRNYPYRGNADGLTTYFRRKFPARSYLGFELEINQKVLEDRSEFKQILDCLTKMPEMLL